MKKTIFETIIFIKDVDCKKIVGERESYRPSFESNLATTLQTNSTAGISIGTYTGAGSSPDNKTIGHGLGAIPDLVLIKGRDGNGLGGAAQYWMVGAPNLPAFGNGNNNHTFLDTTNAFRFYNLKKIDRNFIKKCESNDYDFFFTSLVVLNLYKYRISQIPMVIKNRTEGVSKMLVQHMIKSVFNMFFLFLKVKLGLFK